MSKGRNVSDFFSHVVKLVGVPNLEVRKMVYIYLARYANHDASCREMALLSINAFQRGLADREPLMRSMALRVLTCLDVPDVLQLQILGVQTCCKDSSPYVRKCAANAVGKLHPRCCEVGDLEQAEQLVGIVTNLLKVEGSTMVLTSVMIAFCEICPQRLDLLHGCYRKVCHLLTDMDEWGQVMVMDALTRYCRTFFKQPKGQLKGAAERIDQERRVTRSTRKMRQKGMDGTADGEGYIAGDGADALLSLGAASNADSTNVNGMTSHVTLPPRQKQKVKRRVVRQAFYSDEEDESSEEEVDPYYPITGGNVSELSRDNPVLATDSGKPGGSRFGFRDDVDAVKDTYSTSNGGVSTTDLDADEDGDLDEDHKLLLQSSLPLLKSRNSAVVLAVCSLQYYCGVASIKTRSALGKALVRIHRDRREIQYVVLVSIRTLVKECPSAFSPFLNDFFVKGMDPSFTRMIKLDILVSLCIDPAAIEAILTELRTYVRHNDRAFACASIRAVGKITELARVVYDRRAFTAGLDASSARREANIIALNCLSGLVTLSEFSRNQLVVGECAETMQRILAQLWSRGYDSINGTDFEFVTDPSRVQERALKRLLLILVRSLSPEEDDNTDEEKPEHDKLKTRTVRVPGNAISSIVWVIGEWFILSKARSPWNIDLEKKACIQLETLRLLSRCFPELNSGIKLQAVHLASKMLLIVKANAQQSSSTSSKVSALCEFILAMGRVDVAQDVRDRSRYESNILQVAMGLSHDTSSMQSTPGSNLISLEQAKSMLLYEKPTASSLPLDGKEFGSIKNETDLFRFGTLSSVVCHKVGGSSLPLPKWSDANSPSALRDPPAPEDDNALMNGSHEAGGLYSSSSGDKSSSSDESASDESSSEETDDSSSESDDSDSDGNNDVTEKLSNVFGNGVVTNSTFSAHSSKLERPAPCNSVESSSSSSSSSDTDSDSDESSEGIDPPDDGGDSCAKFPSELSVGIILEMDAANQTQIPMQFSKQASVASSQIAAGLEDLVMSPLVVDKNDISQPLNDIEDSGPWKDIVKPELGGGLFAKMRFLHGSKRTKEAQVMGLDPANPSTVCLEVHIENMRTDAGTLRHVRLVHRGGTGNGIIAPSRVISPPEIPILKQGQTTSIFIGLTFASATDRDGMVLAKFDIKSDRGSSPVEIRPSLGELLDSPNSMSQSEFDKACTELQGIHQRITSVVSVSSKNDDVYGKIPIAILQHLNLKQVGKWTDKGCFVGTLPASRNNVYVVIECNTLRKTCEIIVCGNNAMASNSIIGLVKQALQQLLKS